VRDLLAKRNLTDYALRVFISGGGCSGYQYGMALENNIRDEDLSWDFDDVKLVVDEVSINYLRGATVDFVEDVMGSGFKIENPMQFLPALRLPPHQRRGWRLERGGCGCYCL
jgi:iron-sulfur cluster assembly protein